LNSLSDLISDHRLFKGLPEGTQHLISQTAVRKTFEAGEIMVHKEDVWPYLFYVAKGEIHAIKESQDGRALIATALKPGDIFWGLAFFIQGAPMPVLLQADSDAVITFWSREILLPIIKENGNMAWTLCQIMISQMQLASEIVEELAFQPVMGRLAGLLLELFGDAVDELIERELTLEDMAFRIGTTREMVCRHLYRFAEKGAIEISRTELKIQDRSILEKQARR
jgi:CRP/FNR family transcriptional regulator